MWPTSFRRVALAALTSIALFTACGPPVTPHWQTQLEHCPTIEEIGQLQPMDQLEIRVYNNEEMSGTYELSSAGTINFPLLGTLEIRDKRCEQVAQMITTRLADGLMQQPSVTCITINAQRTSISVDGEVRNPGTIPFRQGLMLTDAIAESQGLTPRAHENLTITRKLEDGRTQAFTVPYLDIVQGLAGSPNVCLHPGDALYVSRIEI